MSDPVETVPEMVVRARALRYEGRSDDARALFTDALAAARATEAPADLIPALKGVAQVARDEGRPADALPFYEEAVGHCRDEGDWAALGHTLRHVGDTHLDLGDVGAAEAPLEETLALYRAHEDEVSTLELANTLRVVALLREGLGRGDEAETLWVQTRGLYAELGICEGVQECDEHIAALDRR